MYMLHDMLMDPKSAQMATIMFVDMTNSTEITATTPESTWIANYGRAFDAIAHEVAAAADGEVVKFLGDGVMVRFPGDKPAEAINCAIRIQETIKELNRHEINCVFSIGIATGRVRQFKTAEGIADYLGKPVNKASRLCSAASSQAIIIDEETRDGANLLSIFSEYGKAADRQGRSYLSEQISTPLKGIKESVNCYEICWDKTAYGISGSHHTEAVKNSSIYQNAEKPAPQVTQIGYGTISSYKRDGDFVFIDGDDHVSYYSKPSFFLQDVEPEVGYKVFFHKRPPFSEGKSPVASSVIMVGEDYEGLVSKVLEKFCFVKIRGEKGEDHDVFYWLGDMPKNFEEGDSVEIELKDHYVKKEERFKAAGCNLELVS
jgi:class 3 adenylate cyclase